MGVIDKTGNRYGNLMVLGLSHRKLRSPSIGYYNFWLCQCDCGNTTVVLANNLTKGNTKSCGCQSSRNKIKDKMTTHGEGSVLRRTKTYNSWRAMKDRCYSKGHKEYKRYGAVGIEVCDRWRNSYENFLSDMGRRPDKHTLDRINPYGNYEPTNCRWASLTTQRNNTRKNYAKENK
jgi:hypothetical protein